MTQDEKMPAAVVTPATRAAWVWLIPLAALAVAAGLVVTYVVKHGSVITVAMAEGYGIKTGDVVRCRGIVVGEVEAVQLTHDLRSVTLTVRLDPSAGHVAHEGARFWVVRPRVTITGVAGLDTVAGPRYLAVLPGKPDAPAASHFAALADAPVFETLSPGGLELMLTADRRGSLRAGAPVLYRGLVVGAVLSVDLAPGAQAVNVGVYVEPKFANLVRDNSLFWNVSGFDWTMGIHGLRVEVESLQALLDGGVAFATPDKPGKTVEDGHKFELLPRAEERWLEWKPDLSAKPAPAR
jgi:paraquat-inducible protein B